MVSEVAWVRVASALAHDLETYDLEDLKRRAESGDCHVWENGESVMVTEGVYLQDGIGVKIIAAAGKYDEIMAMIADLESSARAAGCKKMITTGRKGWRKTAKQLQWREAAVTLVKDLN